MDIVPTGFDDRLHRLTGGYDVEMVDGNNEARLLHYEPLNLDELRQQAKARLAAERWRREVGGVSFGELTIATDDRSKLLLSGAARKAHRDPGYVAAVKEPSGRFISVGATTLISLMDALEDHVHTLFAAEASIAAQIDACDDPATLAAWDVTVGWPA